MRKEEKVTANEKELLSDEMLMEIAAGELSEETNGLINVNLVNCIKLCMAENIDSKSCRKRCCKAKGV